MIVMYGTLRNRPYIDKEGKNRTSTQIIVNDCEIRQKFYNKHKRSLLYQKELNKIKRMKK
jgi:single-stranded DNA-binding protein